MTRALITQMLEALDTIAAYGSQNAECARLGYKAREAAREYLAAPEQSEPVDKSQWWYTELRDFWGSADHVVTLDTRRAAKVALDYVFRAPQPTTPEPVNQALLAALNACADALCNSQNFILSVSSDGFGAVCAEANGIAIDMANEILDAAEQSAQPELTDEQIRAIVYDTRYNGIYDTVRACIAAAQKGTK